MTYNNMHLADINNNMEKHITIKIINGSSKESIILTLDCTHLTSICIKKALPLCAQLVTNGNNRLLFLGSKDSKLELEPLYNIAVLIQSLLDRHLIWDIIDEAPKADEPQELNAYLIINDDK